MTSSLLKSSRNLRSARIRTGNGTAAVSLGLFLLSVCLAALLYGWMSAPKESRQEEDTYRIAKSKEELPEVHAWHRVEGFPASFAQLETVFWEPDDTQSMRKWLKESGRLVGSDVMEIGCGTGLVAITCALNGAKRVVATDINFAAVGNTAYNAENCKVTEIVKVRRVNEEHPSPFEVIAKDEKFDLILSNPPWEDQPVTTTASYAFYDPGFKLLDGMLEEADNYLKPGGSLLLAYGCKTAIERVQQLAPTHGWEVRIHDSRPLNDLTELFLPGMLLELTPTR